MKNLIELIKNNTLLIRGKIVLFFLCLTLSSTGFTSEKSKEDQAFYAICSLRFYIDGKIHELAKPANPENNKIEFDEASIANLWSVSSEALIHYRQQLEIAKQSYYNSIGRPASEAKKGFAYSKHILDSIWGNLSKKFLRKVSKHTSLAKDLAPQANPEPSIEHYLLPNDHFLRPILDKIFASPYVLQDQASLDAAGFTTLYHRSSGMRVAQHNLLKGHLIKAYLNAEKKRSGEHFDWLLHRCMGAEEVRDLIKAKKLKHFSVPDKWIYLLPGQPFPDPQMQTAVLVVTNMNLVTPEKSVKAWKTKITKEHLKELYCILSHGFASCYLPYNIPYTKDGKFSCIDTAYRPRKHHYEKVRSYLSEEMKEYWDKLVKTGGTP